MADLEAFEIDQTQRLISVEAFSAGATMALAVSFSGVEALSTLSSFRLEIVSKGRPFKPDEVLGKTLTIAIRYKGLVRKFSGITVRFEVVGASFRGHFLHLLEIAPPAWLLTLNRRHKIYADKASHEIIASVLSDGGMTFSVKSVGATREYWVQYAESDFNFVSRLLEEEGLFYRFDHSAESCKLIVGDGSADYATADPPNVDAFLDIDSWQTRYHIGPSKFQHVAWDFKAVSVMDGTAQGLTSVQPPGLSPRSVYEYPGRHETVDEGDKLAQARMEAEEAQLVWIPAASDNCRAEPGSKFQIKDRSIDMPDGSTEDSYVMVRVEHDAKDYTSVPFEGTTDYGNSFHCIPSSLDFRPPRLTPRPFIRGPQTATVTETPDEFGRAKVKFHWEEAVSRWTRVAQFWAYNSMGSQYLPRVDSEVVVEFLDGDPDHPIIVGMVYNGKNKLPYALPDNKTQSGIRGANWGSQGIADKSNELRFEDKSGAEEIYIHAQKDFRRDVVNDDNLKVEQGNRTIEVQTGNVKETLGQGNYTTTLNAGNHSLKIDAGTSTVEAMQSITLKVGQNSIVIDQTGVTIKAIMITVQGQATVEIKSPMTTVKGDGMLTLKGGITMIN